jgi:hypothetical protein
MSIKRLLVAALLAAGVAGPLTAQEPTNISGSNRLEGTWDLVLTFSDGGQVASILNVAAGNSPNNGSVIHSAVPSLTPPNPTLPEQGAWRRTGRRTFVASYYGFSYTETFQPFGRIGWRHAITLGKNGKTFTGQAVFEVIDSSGTVLFSDNVQTAGTRQVAVAP